MERPTKDELERAIRYLAPVLEREADAAALSLAASFTPGQTTLDQVAAQTGKAEGIRAAVQVMSAHVAELRG